MANPGVSIYVDLPVSQRYVYYRFDYIWVWSFNLNLIGQDQFPPGENTTGGQNDVGPNPVAPDYANNLRTWTYNLTLYIAPPPTPPYLPIAASRVLDLPAQPTYPIQLRTQLAGPAPVFVPIVGPWQVVYNQFNWPLTPAAQQPERSITASYNWKLLGQDKLPPGKMLTDLPAAATVRFDTWITSVSLALRVGLRPFVQSDWPLTAAQQPDITLRTWIQSVSVALLHPPPPGPLGILFNQYDWPLPRAYPRIDQFVGYTSPFAPIPPPFIGAQYFLLQPHYIKDNWLPAWTVVTEGKEIPIGWIPTLMVDPLNVQAVNAFYAAGPRTGYQGPGFDWQGPQNFSGALQASIQSPKTFWVQSSPGMFKLTGLGVGFPPIGGL